MSSDCYNMLGSKRNRDSLREVHIKSLLHNIADYFSAIAYCTQQTVYLNEMDSRGTSV